MIYKGRFMPKIDDLELSIRRKKLEIRHQQCQAYIDNMNGGNFDKSHITAANMIGQFAGRSVTQSRNTSSKEAQAYQIYLNSIFKDQLHNNVVNSVKETEPHISNRNS